MEISSIFIAKSFYSLGLASHSTEKSFQNLFKTLDLLDISVEIRI